MRHPVITVKDQESIDLILEALDDIEAGRTPSAKAMVQLREHCLACSMIVAGMAERLYSSDVPILKDQRVSRAISTSVTLLNRFCGLSSVGTA